MRRIPTFSSLVLLVLAALSACSGSRKDASLPPHYAAAPPGRGPAAATILPPPSGDEVLDGFLAEVAAAFERHDWHALAYTFYPEDHARQFALMRNGGLSPEGAVSKVLEETVGLGYVDNHVYPAGLDRADRPFAGLERLRVVEITSVEGAAPYWEVEGSVRLDDRTSRRLGFSVEVYGDGYRVVVPQG